MKGQSEIADFPKFQQNAGKLWQQCDFNTAKLLVTKHKGGGGALWYFL